MSINFEFKVDISLLNKENNNKGTSINGTVASGIENFKAEKS